MDAQSIGAPAPIVFQNTKFEVIDRDGQRWLRLFQVGSALGYADPSMLVRVYQRHADEFTADMTALVKLPGPGGEQETRIFSPRGCYALGMFARTKPAKAFRVWVLDVLEREQSRNPLQLPAFDVRAAMLSGNSTPTVRLPPAIQSELNKKAWSMAHDAYELSREYLARRVAYRSEIGHPRRLDEDRARQMIESATLDEALVPAFHNQLGLALNFAELARDNLNKMVGDARIALGYRG